MSERLRAELALLDLRLHRQVLRLRGAHLLAEDQFRGLYISDEHADALLRNAGRADDTTAAELTRRIAADRERIATLGGPLANIEQRYGRFAAELLVIAAAPELALRYQTLYAYAQNDVTRKSPTVDLALQLLCDSDDERAARRDELRPDAPIVRDHLLRLIDDPHDVAPPLLARYVRTDARVADHLRGSDALDAALVRVARRAAPQPPHALAPRLQRGCVFIEGAAGSGRTAFAASLAPSLLVVDGARLTADLVPLLRREALLSGLAIAIASFDDVTVHDALAAELLDLDRPLFLLGTRPWQPERAWRDLPWFSFTRPAPSFHERAAMWRNALGTDLDVDDVAEKFLLTRGQIERAARAAASTAELHDSPITAGGLAAAARAQAAHRLHTLAERVECRHEWDDIVLPPRLLRQLRDVCRAIRFRHVVYGDWGFDRRTASGKGLVALFSGPSGTGKTMAASIVARELGLEMYRIDLSAVVSKYIGETEKNLSRIFDEAKASNAILFFDEADALFGKRSEVRDAHDRYANIETAYLLQRVESYEGCVILATNLGRNLDEAFSRRIHHALEFPLPDPADRERIWRRTLPPAAPLAPDVDVALLANRFDLPGGNIRNIAVAAAFTAAAGKRPIAMSDFVEATARELRKVGRLPSRVEFGEWFGRVEGTA